MLLGELLKHRAKEEFLKDYTKNTNIEGKTDKFDWKLRTSILQNHEDSERQSLNWQEMSTMYEIKKTLVFRKCENWKLVRKCQITQ